MSDDEDCKLYVKMTCSICMGGKRNIGYNSCPYCNMDKKTFVEASPSIIQNYLLASLGPQQKKEVIKILEESINETII